MQVTVYVSYVCELFRTLAAVSDRDITQTAINKTGNSRLMLPTCLGCLWLQMWLELVFEPRRHQPTTGNANKLLKINWDKRDPERTNFPKLVSGIWSTVYQEIM